MNRKSSRSKNRSLPTPRDEQILRAIATHTYLTGEHIRRLFFQLDDRLAARQTVGTRLRRLRDAGYLTAVVVDGGRGAGPHAYGLAPLGSAVIGVPALRPRGRPVAPRHALEVAGFRVALELALAEEGGRLLSWMGERELRGLSRPGDPVPDGLAHWQLDGREGLFALELDLDTESFGTLIQKFIRYSSWWRNRRYPGLTDTLGMKPRLVIVTSAARARRLVTTISRKRHISGTIVIAPVELAMAQPLSRCWWRSDIGIAGRLCA